MPGRVPSRGAWAAQGARKHSGPALSAHGARQRGRAVHKGEQIFDSGLRVRGAEKPQCWLQGSAPLGQPGLTLVHPWGGARRPFQRASTPFRGVS